MLTREMALAEYQGGRIVPDRLTRTAHGHYLRYAERMLRVYRLGIGRTRQELHRAVWAIFSDEPDCPRRRIDAFCKLLDDVSTFQRDIGKKAAALRRAVFRAAAAYHPLVSSVDRLFDHQEVEVKRAIAARLRRSWDQIEAELFADVIAFHRLVAFEGYPDAAALLARYNVAQVQAALFDAVSMAVWAMEDYKTILRYAKLARLMHTITRLDDGRYLFRFDGPASVLRRTRRYGVAMARFLPALIACRGWRMHAVIRSRHRNVLASLDLSWLDGLRSHLPPPETFDSSVEESFATRWGDQKRAGWHIVREGEILHRGQRVFTPDFVFRHDDGRRVFLEIVGFWTPEYLQAKLDTLRAFEGQPILLAVNERVGAKVPAVSPTIIPFKTSLAVNDVLERLG